MAWLDHGSPFRTSLNLLYNGMIYGVFTVFKALGCDETPSRSLTFIDLQGLSGRLAKSVKTCALSISVHVLSMAFIGIREYQCLDIKKYIFFCKYNYKYTCLVSLFVKIIIIYHK